MENNEKYNGWTNRETWLVNVWEIPEMIEDRNRSIEEIAGELESIVSEMLYESMPDASGFIGDLLPSADSILARINFEELASHVSELEGE